MPKVNISFPALRLKQNNHLFYFSTIPVDDLFPSCFVVRRDEDPLEGFQRALNESRADDIAKYLANGNGSIPSNVVLSAQPGADFKYEARSKSIAFKRVSSAFLVLDGQHRLWGYQKCRIRHRVPVAIYSGLSRKEEANLFIDINTTQRGVPAALLLDIKQVAQTENTREITLRTLFDRLNKDDKSSLAGKLSPSKSTAGKISRVTFNRALEHTLNSGALGDLGVDKRYLIIRNYLNAYDAELADKKLLTRAAFFEAIFQVFDTIIQRAIAESNNVKQDSIQSIVAPLARLDYRTVEGGALLERPAITTLMQTALQTKTKISDEMV